MRSTIEQGKQLVRNEAAAVVIPASPRQTNSGHGFVMPITEGTAGGARRRYRNHQQKNFAWFSKVS